MKIPRSFCPVLLLFLSLTSSAAAKDEIITSKTLHTQPAKFAQAVDEQLGVFGNDFFGEIFVGTAPNEGALNKNVYFPVDGFKRTFVGRQTNVFSVAVENAGDDDVNLVLETRPDHPLILANEKRLRGEKATHQLNVVNGEIDLHQTHMHLLRKYAASTPKANVDAVGMYGPWVIDRGWFDEKHWYLPDAALPGHQGHPNYIEIHPMEQLWWVEKQGDSRIFHLAFMNDNSGRFDKRSRFDTDEGTLNRIWVENPMIGRFAVAFEVRPGKPVEYVIERIGDKHAHAPADGRVHKLVMDGKTLVTVREPADGPDLITVGFRFAGVVPAPAQSKTHASSAVIGLAPTLVRGFIVIQTTVGVGSDVAGNLFLKVTEKRVQQQAPPTHLPVGTKTRTRVTLDSFSCTGADDDGGVEEVHGYVGVRVTSPAAWPKTANILPADSSSPLLWSLLDDLGSLHLRKSQTVRINKSFHYDLDNQAEITLVADLNEDDDSGDDNPTTADGDDDRLASIKSKDCQAGLCRRTIKVSELALGKPLPVAFTFGSGGTLVTVHLKVEKLTAAPGLAQ